MKRLLPGPMLFAVTDALAHPGHGKPGWQHFHEFSDGLLLVVGLGVAALLYWMFKE